MQGKAENLEACGHPVVPTLPLPLSNLANTGIKTPAVLLEHFMLSFPEKSWWVLPLIETSSLSRNKSSSGAQRSRKSWGILSLAFALCYHLGVLLRLQKRLELWPWGHSRGRLPSSSLKPIQLKWQKQVAAIFKPVWGTPCDSTGNVQLKFLKRGGELWGGAATEQANDCTVYIGKLADSSNLYLKRKCYQSILYLLLENIWSTDNTEGIEFLLLGCLAVCLLSPFG